MCQDISFIVGFMTERCFPVDIAQRIHAVNGGFQEFIGHNPTTAFRLNRRIFQMKFFRSRFDARSHQDFFAAHFFYFTGSTVANNHHFFAVFNANFFRFLIQNNVNAKARNVFVNLRGDFFVFLRQ